jgi:hypothetical protein
MEYLKRLFKYEAEDGDWDSLALIIQKRLIEQSQQRRMESNEDGPAIESPQSFHTATPGSTVILTPQRLTTTTEYGQLIAQKDLLVAREVELNWSGRGQHVEYGMQEHVPLTTLNVLGHSATALVEAVECRRILIARKSIRLRRNIKLVDLLGEIEHMHQLRHRHVIQLVGSYLQGRTFAMLLYPTVSPHLGTYMEHLTDSITRDPESTVAGFRSQKLGRSMLCLAKALAYVHSKGITHLDIKPENILLSEAGHPHDPGRIYM